MSSMISAPVVALTMMASSTVIGGPSVHASHEASASAEAALSA
ncbi:MAG: hypothetical protein ACK4TL_06825 [Hyphomicrobiaceae bacterium]